MVDEKNAFIAGLKQEWFAEAKKGIFDAKSREGMELKTSYSDN